MAEVLLRENRPADALHALEPAADFIALDTDLLFERARVYRALHRLADAEADLRTLANRPSTDPNSPTVTAAELTLIDVLMAEGKTDDANSLLSTWRTRWQHADPETSLYREAAMSLRQPLS